MSSPPATHDRRASSARDAGSNEQHAKQGSRARGEPSIARAIHVVGFWTAIVLPFLYVPMLATGLSSSTETTIFLCLLALNFVALYVGHPHRN